MCYKLTVALTASFLAVSCGKTPARQVERIAAPPFANLTGKQELEWMSPVFSSAIQQETAGAPQLQTLAVRTMGDGEAQSPSRVLSGYYTVEGGALVARASLWDPATQRTVSLFEERGDPSAGPAPLAANLAGKLSGRTKQSAAPDREAVRLFGESLLAANPADAIAKLREAIAKDPSYAVLYLPLATTLARTGDRAGSLQVVRDGLAPDRKFDEITRVRLEAFRAALEGNDDARLAATERLAALTPADPEPAAQLAESYLIRRRYADAVTQYKKALTAQPDLANRWNQVAYAENRAGDYDAALRSLQEYGRLAPGNPNVLDSRGEIQFQAGRFAEAEQSFLQSYQMNPGFLASVTLRKAAEAHLMTGDVAGADTLFAKFVDAAAKAPIMEIQRAHWEYLSGRKKQGLDRLAALAAKPEAAGDLAAAASSQRAVWLLDQGNRAGAMQAAAEAGRQATGEVQKRLARLVAFVAGPEGTASEWAVRAEQEFPNPAESAVKNHSLAYALLYEKHFHEASLLLRTVYQQTHPNSADHVKELLAWSYMEQGNWNEAKPLVALWPVPQSTGEPTFESLVFPRCIEIRARLAEHEGDTKLATELRTVLAKVTAAP